MADIRGRWAAQLRAAAQDIIDHADEIVSDIGPNVSLSVEILLHTDEREIRFPRLVVTREVIPVKARKEKIEELIMHAGQQVGHSEGQ